VNDRPPNAGHEDPKERKVGKYPDGRLLPGNPFQSETTTLSRLETLEQSLKLMKGREEVFRNENHELHKRLKQHTLQLNKLTTEHQELQGNLNLPQARESLISQELTRVRVEIAELQTAAQHDKVCENHALLAFLRLKCSRLTKHLEFSRMKGDQFLAYPPDLVPFYLLFAMKGQTFCEMVSDMLILPCWRTIQRMKEKFL
jgi:hypothetical protein